MAHATTDPLDRADAAFAGNRLLSTFDADARAMIEPHGEIVELEPGEIVLRRGEQVTSSVFPIGGTVVSMGVVLNGGRSLEVASIGCDGAVGGIVSCGHAPAFSRAEALVAGTAYRVPMDAIENAKRRSSFVANIFCRFSDYLLSQVMQSAACAAFHTIPERAARWLLQAQDRGGDRIELTQEAFAALLGVQRTTINAVIRAFQGEGLVSTGRGVINILDRAGLEHRSCECYQQLADHFDDIIGATGSGGG